MSVIPAHSPQVDRFNFSPNGRIQRDGGGEAIQSDCFYHIEEERIPRAFGTTFPARLADLSGLAMAVYAADRLVRRDPAGSDRYNLHWTRQIDVELPVRDLPFWRRTDLLNRLREVLWFFTEDEWRLGFRRRDSDPRQSESQQPLFPSPPESPVTAALFSGGLDSLAGLWRRSVTRPWGSFVLLSGSTNYRIRAIQQSLIRDLRRIMAAPLHSVNVPFGLQWHAGRGSEERTQRSRGFVFLALGAITAFLAGSDSLEIFENGVGAINLPYTEAQLGAHNTRAVHPVALAKMSQLVSDVIDRPFTFHNPWLFLTKGQLCSGLAASGVRELVRQTVSCDGFPQRVKARPQCGHCTSCLLRRQALDVAGLRSCDTPDLYRYDIRNASADWSPAKRYPFQAMSAQVSRLESALLSSDPWQSLSVVHPQIREVACVLSGQSQSSRAAEDRVIQLYRQYCTEWRRFAFGIPSSHLGTVA